MKSLALILGLIFLSGCATVVTEDYPQYLRNNQGQTFPVLGDEAQYIITPSTKAHSHKISSFMAGKGNSWYVKFGPLLGATLQSPDIQKSFKSLKEDSGAGAGAKLFTFHLNSYDFSNHRAKIEMKISVTKDGKTILDRTYQANGISQGGKMFWGGAMAMKNAVQQSTKNSMDTIMRSFLTDLSAVK